MGKGGVRVCWPGTWTGSLDQRPLVWEARVGSTGAGDVAGARGLQDVGPAGGDDPRPVIALLQLALDGGDEAARAHLATLLELGGRAT
ncbi:MAG: hypothetical protein WKF75_03895 [Singulisphaera sp.]